MLGRLHMDIDTCISEALSTARKFEVRETLKPKSRITCSVPILASEFLRVIETGYSDPAWSCFLASLRKMQYQKA